MGTLNLVKTALENKVVVLYSHPRATYGIPKVIPIKEDSLQNPINPYGQSKLMIEQMLKWISNVADLNVVALRYFNAAGASLDLDIGERHEPETHLLPLAIRSVMNNTEFSVFGNDYDTPDGTCIRDFIHVLDLADAHIRALDYLLEEKKSNYFNLGTGNGFSVLEIIKKIEEFTQKKCPIKFQDRRPGDPGILAVDPTKANQILIGSLIYQIWIILLKPLTSGIKLIVSIDYATF